MAEFDKLRKTCAEVKALRHCSFDFYNQIFITDDKEVLDAAIKERDADGCFFNVYQNYSCIKFICDGPLTIHPTWEDVLVVNDIIDKNKPLYINDTLILDVSSNGNYDRIVPLINGPYSRLILYGDFTWTQVKRLIHDNVKQIRIMGTVAVNESDNVDVVKFVHRFSRGLEYKFSFDDECFSPSLVNQLNKACRNRKTVDLVNHLSGITHVVYKGCQYSYYRYASVLLLINLGALLFFGYLFKYDVTVEDGVKYLHLHWIIKRNRLPKDIKVYASLEHANSE
uniref:Receptor L-domain domain-containing protein n=1 Tax=Panagrellus redivivus TaxID=6233 RepID=A0A7E4VHY5_PANRE